MKFNYYDIMALIGLDAYWGNKFAQCEIDEDIMKGFNKEAFIYYSNKLDKICDKFKLNKKDIINDVLFGKCKEWVVEEDE